MAGHEPALGTLSDKLNHLFATVHPAGRGAYSNEEVAAAVRDTGGPTVSATYIWQLRKGLRDNPTKKHLEALAGFFGVPPAYFFDDTAAKHLEDLHMLRNASVRQIATRATGLSPITLRALADLVEAARRLEG